MRLLPIECPGRVRVEGAGGGAGGRGGLQPASPQTHWKAFLLKINPVRPRPAASQPCLSARQPSPINPLQRSTYAQTILRMCPGRRWDISTPLQHTLYYTDTCKKKEEKCRLPRRGAALYSERPARRFLWPACACTVAYIRLVNLQLLNHLLPMAVFHVPPLASNLWAAGVRALKLPLAKIELLTQSKVQIFPRRSPSGR